MQEVTGDDGRVQRDMALRAMVASVDEDYRRSCWRLAAVYSRKMRGEHGREVAGSPLASRRVVGGSFGAGELW